MDPRTNPYAPGAGTPPPALVGRDEQIESGDTYLIPELAESEIRYVSPDSDGWMSIAGRSPSRGEGFVVWCSIRYLLANGCLMPLALGSIDRCQELDEGPRIGPSSSDLVL